MQTLVSHNLETSHQNLQKVSGIHIDHKRIKICKNEGFLKLSLFHASWFLQKMALKSQDSQWYMHLMKRKTNKKCWKSINFIPLYCTCKFVSGIICILHLFGFSAKWIHGELEMKYFLFFFFLKSWFLKCRKNWKKINPKVYRL